MARNKRGVAGYKTSYILSRNLNVTDRKAILDDEIESRREGILVSVNKAGEAVSGNGTESLFL